MPTSLWKSANYDLNLASCSHNLISPLYYPPLITATAVFPFCLGRGGLYVMHSETPPPPEVHMQTAHTSVHACWLTFTRHARGETRLQMIRVIHAKARFKMKPGFTSTHAAQITIAAPPPPNVAETTNCHTELHEWTLPEPQWKFFLCKLWFPFWKTQPHQTVFANTFSCCALFICTSWVCHMEHVVH